MRQMMVRTQRSISGDTLGRYILEARAGQVPHVYGYKMDLQVVTAGGLTSRNEYIELYAQLLAAPRGTDALPQVGSGFMDAMNRTRGLIGQHTSIWGIAGPGDGGPVLLNMHSSTGWVPLEFDVPGLWMMLGHVSVGVPNRAQVTFHILFDWIDKTPTQVAALYTTFGIDSVDSQEREASGEVNFSRMVGEGTLPSIVG